MARKSFLQIVEHVKEFANAHHIIKKVGFDFLEQMENFLTEGEDFQALFLVPLPSQMGESLNTWYFDIYCLEPIQKDRANVLNIISDTALSLNDLMLFLNDTENWDFEAELITPIQPVNNLALDYLGGNVATFAITTESYTACEIPIDIINPPSLNCEPVTIRNTEGTTIGTAAAGSVFILEDIDFTFVVNEIETNVSIPAYKNEVINLEWE